MNPTMSITFLGVGSAFTTRDYYQSNLLITARSGRRMLVDCGSDARFSLAEWDAGNGTVDVPIDAVYISHLHADHIGGLEWLAFNTYFNPGLPRPKLYAAAELHERLWNFALRSGLEYIADQVMTISDYFETHEVTADAPFEWEGIQFTPVRLLHVFNSIHPIFSFGLIIQEIIGGKTCFFSTDSVLDIRLRTHLNEWVPKVDLFFQDCETLPFKTRVHAHYEELCTLPETIRQKMWLYHYNPNPPFRPERDGFLGFVRKGQTFV